MRNRSNDEYAEYLKEVINKYEKDPEYVNPHLSKQQALDNLEKHYKSIYFNLNLD